MRNTVRTFKKKLKYYKTYHTNQHALKDRARTAVITACGNRKASHFTTSQWQYYCGCVKILYRNKRCFHFTEVDCDKAKVAYCFDTKTYEWSKHPLLACPYGEYKEIS